jgi:hypothetical protein
VSIYADVFFWSNYHGFHSGDLLLFVGHCFVFAR